MGALEDFRDYLQHRRGSSDRTVRAYLTDVSLALAEIGKFEASEIESYLSLLSGRGTARSTVARKLAALRAYGDFMADAGRVPSNPAQRVAAPHRSHRVASDDYSRKRDRALAEVARATSLKPSELVSANAEDVDWRQNVLRLPASGGPKVAPLGASSRLLRAYLGGRSRGPIFLSASGDRLSVRLAHDILNLNQAP